MMTTLKVGLVGAVVLLGTAACSAEDRDSLSDSARETASSVQDQASSALEDASSQLDEAGQTLQSQAEGLDDELQTSVGDLGQQAEQLASDVRAEGQDISDAERRRPVRRGRLRLGGVQEADQRPRRPGPQLRRLSAPG